MPDKIGMASTNASILAATRALAAASERLLALIAAKPTRKSYEYVSFVVRKNAEPLSLIELPDRGFRARLRLPAFAVEAIERSVASEAWLSAKNGFNPFLLLKPVEDHFKDGVNYNAPRSHAAADGVPLRAFR